MTRHPLWKTRLRDMLLEATAWSYVWGQVDCVHFASRAIQVQSLEGYDLAAAYTRTYRTREQAEELLASSPLVARVNEVCRAAGMLAGGPQGPFGALGFGTCKGVSSPESPAVGVYDEIGYLLVFTERGILRFPPRYCSHSWRIS